jgi:hypothetical protein
MRRFSWSRSMAVQVAGLCLRRGAADADEDRRDYLVADGEQAGDGAGTVRSGGGSDGIRRA